MQKLKKVPAFIRNTYQMLEDIADIVSWSEDGRGFIIRQIDMFSQQILPQYFKHKNYSSFVRQLNMYGFHKQRQHLNYHFFVHQHFRKGVLQEGQKCEVKIQIKRKPQKKKKFCSKNKEQDQNVIRSEDCEYDEQRSVSIMIQDSKEEAQKIKGHQQKLQNKEKEQSIKNEDNHEQQDQSSKHEQISSQRQQKVNNAERQTLEEILIHQNEMLRSIHQRIREDVLAIKKLTIEEMRGKKYESGRQKSKVVNDLIVSLEAKTSEMHNLQSWYN